MSGLRGALSFLTRIPADRSHGAPDVAGALPWFPVVGGLLGLTVAGVYAAAGLALPALPAAALAVTAGILLTGALHEDGLADVADALGAGGPDEARRIMKDPAHGTYGVLALVLSATARIGAVAALDPWAAAAWLTAAHAASRGAAVGLLSRAAPGSSGLGAETASHLPPGAATTALAIGLAASALAVGPWAVPVSALVVAVRWGVGRLAAGRFGGVTGDVVGAAQQGAEILVLLLGAAASTQGWDWWR